jgi:hypothetical protein
MNGSRNVVYTNTMEFYSVIKNNDMWFEGKWIQLEDIMLSEVGQAQKSKGGMLFLIHGRSIQKKTCTQKQA